MIKASEQPHLRLVNIITHSKQGGAQEVILRLAAELHRRGHDVQVWFLYGDCSTYGSDSAIRTVLPDIAPGPLGYVRILLRLVRMLRSVRPDGVISFLPLACVVGQTAAWLSGVRSRVASQRNPYWTYSSVMQFCDKLAGTIGVYTCNVANSKAVLDSFAKYPRTYRSRMKIVYNGIAWRASGLTKDEARAKFGLPYEVPLLVNLGRLSEQKNQALILRALVQLPSVHLAIGGDGELLEDLLGRCQELGVAERVHFLGMLAGEEVAHLLRAADLFVQPSLFEGQSNALLEAMSEGLPVLASDIPPQVETIWGDANEPAGRILPLASPEVWAAAIRELIRDANLRKRLGRMAKERAARFSVERMGDGFEHAVCGSLGVGEPSSDAS